MSENLFTYFMGVSVVTLTPPTLIIIVLGHFFLSLEERSSLGWPLKRSFSEIPTIVLTPYQEFNQRPHTPHTRQLIFKL
jgi:hypothetical protein